MDHHAELVRFGREKVAEQHIALPIEVVSRDEPTRLAQMKSTNLQQVIAESSADWILLADCAVTLVADELVRLINVCAAEETAECVLMSASPLPEINTCWQQLPPQLALLLAPPEDHTVIAIRTSPAAGMKMSDDIERLLWHALIQAANSKGRLSVTAADTSVSRSSSVDSILLPALAPAASTTSPEWLNGQLAQFDVAKIIPEVGSPDDAVALRAGLLQLHDFLDASHDLSQTVQGEGRHQAGDYWHAIMHRREPDYSNAKYWFRRVGRHPIFDALAERSAEILGRCESLAAADWASSLRAANGWEPFAFVDLCEACSQSSDASLIRAAEEIQFAEMLLLIEQTYRDACG